MRSSSEGVARDAGSFIRVAGYRLRTTMGSRWAGYLSLVLCIGLLGGIAMGAIAGARRTQSSFSTYFSNANAPDLAGITGVLNPALGSDAGYDPQQIRAIARLAYVTQIESASGIDVLPLTKGGRPYVVAGFPPAAGNGLGSDDGLYFNLDRVTVVAGRRADPSRAGEVMMPREVATFAGYRVGQVIRLGIYTNAATQLPLFGTSRVRPYRVVTVTLVGTFVDPSSLIEDDVDNSTSLFLFTPAFSRPLLACCSNYTESAIKVERGHVALAGAEIQRALPKEFPAPFQISTVIAKAQRAIEPDSIALGVFGLIAALATLLIAGQVMGRQLRRADDDHATLRALGANRALIASDAALGVFGAILAGSLLAVAVAVAVSPLSPIGPVRPVYPDRGFAVDGIVLGLGFLALSVGLCALAAAVAARQAIRLPASGRGDAGARRSRVSGAAASAGLPPSAVAGIRFALEPGAGRNAVPVRSAMIGAGLAVAITIATITFGASLGSLVSHPSLYGWNWNFILSAGGGSGNIPQAQATRLLNHDPFVGAWSGAYFDDLNLDGQSTPVIGEAPGAAVQPPILTGHRFDRAQDVVLGAITLADLHKRVGDSVVLQNGVGPPVRLTIVGTATMPAIGGPGPHLEMGTGALLDYQLIPAPARDPFNDPVTGPESIFVDLRRGASSSGLARSLQQMSMHLSNNANFGVTTETVLRPAEIVNYRTIGSIPALLGAALCIGAGAALVLTLLASVRRRKRDLALLKALGFTRRQLAAAIAWQSSIAVGIGTIVGVPLGIQMGRFLWDRFADEIHAVPLPIVPASSVVLVAAAALVLANVVAAVPGVLAARTKTSVLLRTE